MLTKNEEIIIECFRKNPEKALEVFQIILEERKASSFQKELKTKNKKTK